MKTDLILNETPIRTANNYNINNITLKDIDIEENVPQFKGMNIINNSSKVSVTETKKNKFLPRYFLSDELIMQSNKDCNVNLKIESNSSNNTQLFIDFEFSKENKSLVDNLDVTVSKNCKLTLILKYDSKDDSVGYHNQLLNIVGKENSNINVIILNFLNKSSNSFVTINNELRKNSKLNYTIIDLGSKNFIMNYYSNMISDYSSNTINSIYIGDNEKVIDLNYILHLRGRECNTDIDIQGALKDNSKKHFKGTIDFKKGCKKSIGNENESCLMLSDKAKSIALPMLLCSEEEVEGNHSSSSGKIDEGDLFYIMSRGFNKKEAMKLMVKAKFNKIIDKLKDENLKSLILDKIDEKLS